MLMLLGLVLQSRAGDAQDDVRVCFWNVGQLMLMMLGVVFEIVRKCGS